VLRVLVKVSLREASQTVNDADVAADDVDTLSGLLEAVALLMMGIQTALEKVLTLSFRNLMIMVAIVMPDIKGLKQQPSIYTYTAG